VVVAGEGQNTAVGRGSRGIGVAEGVSRPVQAGGLAVPHPEDAIVSGTREQPHLLTALDTGRGQVLVDAGLEVDPCGTQVLRRSPEGLVETAEGRAPIAGDEAGRVQAGGRIAPRLDHRQPDQRLDSREKDPAGLQGVAIIEGDVVPDHGDVLQRNCDRRSMLGTGPEDGIAKFALCG
jgi:hypothetical protein